MDFLKQRRSKIKPQNESQQILRHLEKINHTLEERAIKEENQTSFDDIRSAKYYPNKYHSTPDMRYKYGYGSIPNLHYQHSATDSAHFSSFESQRHDLEQIRNDVTKSHERLECTEKQISQFMHCQDQTNKLVQNLCRSVESLVKMADEDLFYEAKTDYSKDDLISESPHKHVVRESLLCLRDNIHPESILHQLVSNRAFNEDEEQSVLIQTTTQRKVRRLVTILERKPPEVFESFLDTLSKDHCHSSLYKQLSSKYEIAKRAAKHTMCKSCYIACNVDIRKISDHMYHQHSLAVNKYEYLVDNQTSLTERWQALREWTPEVSEARDGFINALQDEYPKVEEKIKGMFTLNTGNLACTCENRHRRKSRNSEPKTIKRRVGAKFAKDIKNHFQRHDVNDSCSTSTIHHFMTEDSNIDDTERNYSCLTDSDSSCDEDLIIRQNEPQSIEILEQSEVEAEEINQTTMDEVEYSRTELPVSNIQEPEDIKKHDKEEVRSTNWHKILTLVLGLFVLIQVLFMTYTVLVNKDTVESYLNLPERIIIFIMNKIGIE